MRRCRRCGVEKPTTAFYPRRSPGRGEFHEWCRDCFKDYRLRYYAENRESELRRLRGVRQRLIEQWHARRLEYLREHPCVDCGETDPDVLEFDHQRDKVDHVAVMARVRRRSIIEAEIAKCEVRCANCHRRKTARERGYYRWLSDGAIN